MNLDSVTDFEMTVVSVVVVALPWALLFAAGVWIALTAYRTKRRNARRFAGGIPGTARMLAARVGSRMNMADWTNTLHDFYLAGFTLEETLKLIQAFPGMSRFVRPAFDFRGWMARKNAWSIQTFGPGDAADRAAGILDHIRKELQEIEREPMDVEEWIDVAFLSLDGAFRAGGTPSAVTDALAAKLEKNIGRKWPDWRNAVPGKAIEHDRTADRSGR